MPHYADGTEAKVGDHVTGKLYNTEGVRAGTIISITPGQESCNALVQFTEARKFGGPLGEEPVGPPLMPEQPRMGGHGVRVVKGRDHGSSGPAYMLFTCADYCATNELTKVGGAAP